VAAAESGVARAMSTPHPGPIAAAPRTEEPLDVARLCARIRNGDADAFEAFYRSWFAGVLSMARTTTRRDEAFCLDVVQEVMMRAARALPPLSSPGELGAWMTRCTLSVCVDQIRRETRRARREAAAPRLAREHDEHRATSAEDVAWLEGALRNLGPIDFELVMARLAKGVSLREAGKALGMSEDAAHGRVRRAVQSLRNAARSMWS